jgi:hypothetical protein
VRRLWRLLLASALALAPAPARAEEGKVLVLVAPSATGLALRIRAELEALGFSVELRPSTTAPVEIDHLADEARSAGAVAAVQVQKASRQVGLWLFDRVTGKAVRREVPGDQSTDEVLAVKTTELLWASLIEIQRPGFVPAEVPPPTSARQLLAATPLLPLKAPLPRLRPLVGAGALWVGALGTAVNVTAGAEFSLDPALFVSLRIGAPISRPLLSGPEGLSSQTLSISTLDMGLRLRPRGRVTAGASLVVGAFWLHTQSTAAPPYRDASDSVFSMVIGARPTLRMRITSALTLRLDTTAQTLIPRPRVLFAGRPVAQAPIASLDASLIAELTLW